jgi:hypothetical protein
MPPSRFVRRLCTWLYPDITLSHKVGPNQTSLESQDSSSDTQPPNTTLSYIPTPSQVSLESQASLGNAQTPNTTVSHIPTPSQISLQLQDSSSNTQSLNTTLSHVLAPNESSLKSQDSLSSAQPPDTTASHALAPSQSLLESQASSSNTDPPPYESSLRIGIKATDTPQWLWSNEQCRSWIIAVCVTLLNNSLEEAEEKAKRYRGFGPSIFENNIEAWKSIFQNEYDSESVYSLVMSKRDESGAVPLGWTYPHREARGRSEQEINAHTTLMTDISRLLDGWDNFS